MSEQVTVYKLNAQGEEVWSYPGEVLHRSPNHIVLQALFDREEVRLPLLTLRRGDRFIEYYYRDRWYNVFEVHAVEDGHLRGWYCNITRPARFEDQAVYAEDLALDLVVTPNGQLQVLDEKDFAALTLSPEERRAALSALEELVAAASAQEAPFRSAP